MDPKIHNALERSCLGSSKEESTAAASTPVFSCRSLTQRQLAPSNTRKHPELDLGAASLPSSLVSPSYSVTPSCPPSDGEVTNPSSKMTVNRVDMV